MEAVAAHAVPFQPSSVYSWLPVLLLSLLGPVANVQPLQRNRCSFSFRHFSWIQNVALGQGASPEDGQVLEEYLACSHHFWAHQLFA